MVGQKEQADCPKKQEVGTQAEPKATRMPEFACARQFVRSASIAANCIRC